MTYLRNHCLGRQPMTHDEVNAIYKSGKCPDLCMSHERLRAELTGMEIVHNDTTNEVASVLMLMDELADLWGDEAVFRRCRDRLRKLVGDTNP